MRLAFVLWSKKHKRCWLDFTAFVAKAQTRVAALMFALFIRKQGAPAMHASNNTDLIRGV